MKSIYNTPKIMFSQLYSADILTVSISDTALGIGEDDMVIRFN